jgi:hypothetical protein
LHPVIFGLAISIPTDFSGPVGIEIARPKITGCNNIEETNP